MDQDLMKAQRGGIPPDPDPQPDLIGYVPPMDRRPL